MSENAHRTAHVALMAAAAKIEKRPGLEELKQARDMVKSAYQTLGSAYTLAAKGIPRIVDEAEDEPAPLFDGDEGADDGEGQETPETPEEPVPSEAPTPMPGTDPEALPALGMRLAEDAPPTDAIDVEVVDSEDHTHDEPHPDEYPKADARRVGTEERRMSTKLLQNKLGWGYDKARRILDALIAEGFCTESGEVNE